MPLVPYRCPVVRRTPLRDRRSLSLLCELLDESLSSDGDDSPVKACMPRRLNLSGQGSATLSATAGNNVTSSASTHAGTEAMYTSATTVVRLEGPLALGHGHHSSNSHALFSAGFS